MENCGGYTTVGEQFACSERNMQLEYERYCALGSQEDCAAAGMSMPAGVIAWNDPNNPAVVAQNMFLKQQAQAGNAYVTGWFENGVWIPATPTNVAQSLTTANPTVTATPMTTTAGARTSSFDFQVPRSGALLAGDRWKVIITGATPNAPVSVKGGKDGVGAEQTLGTTNASGSWVLEGTTSANDVGNWFEQWFVNRYWVGDVVFTVAQTQSTQTQQTTGGNTNTNSTNVPTNPNYPATAPVVSGSSSNGFVIGLQSIASPDSWDEIFASGDMTQILGLVAIPALIGGLLVFGGGRR